MKFFSIITINLNNSKGLLKTIESVVNQTNKNYEFIIIDGKSTDDSIEVIKQFQNKLSYWISESDKGIYHAMNKGISIAQGKYCFFLNSGDYFLDNTLLEQINKFALNESFIYGNLVVGESDQRKGSHKGKAKLSFLDLFLSQVKHQSTFIKRDLFDKYGFYNEELKIVSDWEFFLKTIGLNNESYKYIDIDIAFFDETGISNNSINFAKISEEREVILKTMLNPLILEDYNTFSKYLFLEQSLNNCFSRFFLKLIAKLTKYFFRFLKVK